MLKNRTLLFLSLIFIFLLPVACGGGDDSESEIVEPTATIVAAPLATVAPDPVSAEESYPTGSFGSLSEGAYPGAAPVDALEAYPAAQPQSAYPAAETNSESAYPTNN